MTNLRRSYDLPLMKVLSPLQDDDKTLAADIGSSREAIWSLLADPQKFATLRSGDNDYDASARTRTGITST